MAWCAKERDGKEVIFRCKPKLDSFTGQWSDEITDFVITNHYFGSGHSETIRENSRIILPKGTIESITGIKMSYKDKPIKFKRYER